ncbi:MAG: hypothetical protein QOE54_2328 [Streptosporangiaceae bacterium]|jgi:hypothetical protein|nr:hypothetical protein [Streptosporangiaceae bacterium]MDX6429962.1 hypothetical protein [Streptosporangiaceae bacterium]
MGSRVQRGEASGPAEWLLVFLQARDVPPRARTGLAAGPAEWLLVFLDAACATASTMRRSAQAQSGLPFPAQALSESEGVLLDRFAVQGA